ncbi:MAG: helix-turn-helix domain-containing protein [Actinomycetota bacterium]
MSEAPKWDEFTKELTKRMGLDHSLSVAVPAPLIEAIAMRAAELVGERLTAEREPWIRVEEAAEHLACKTNRIYALASAGRIPCRRDGARLLFRRSELDAWLKAGGGKRP